MTQEFSGVSRRTAWLVMLLLLSLTGLMVAAPPPDSARAASFHYRLTGVTDGVLDPGGSGCFVNLFIEARTGGVSYYKSMFCPNDRNRSRKLSRFGDAKPTIFTVAADLSQARVTAKIPVKDGNGKPAGTLSFDDRWTAYRPATGPPHVPEGVLLRDAYVTGTHPANSGAIIQCSDTAEPGGPCP